MLKPQGNVAVSLGELLVEVMRPEVGVPLDTPGVFAGPFASGAPAIFAWAAASLGAHVRFAGVVGEDPFGVLCQRHLAQAGVALHVRTTPDFGTGVAFVSYSGTGARDFVFHLRHSAAAQLSPADVTPELLKNVGWLHVTGSSLSVSESLRQAVFVAVEQAKAAGAVVSFDPNLRPELLREVGLDELCGPVLEAAAVVLPSGAEAEVLTGLSDPLAACRKLLERAEVVLLKRGAAGCTVFAEGLEYALPSLPVREVDPTGAGDCFAAGFAAATLNGFDLSGAARFANAVGALSVTAFGPTAAALSYKQVLGSLRF